MFGLAGAGKTEALYTLKEQAHTQQQLIPTIGFNVETVSSIGDLLSTTKNMRLTLWDVGGHPKITVLWRHYLNNRHGYVFVIDSANTNHYSEQNSSEPFDSFQDMMVTAREELTTILHYEDCAHGAPLLILANKQDLKQAYGMYDIAEHLNLTEQQATDANKRVARVEQVLRDHVRPALPVSIVNVIVDMLPWHDVKGVTLKGDHPFMIFECIATQYDTLVPAFTWFLQQIQKFNKRK